MADETGQVLETSKYIQNAFHAPLMNRQGRIVLLSMLRWLTNAVAPLPIAHDLTYELECDSRGKSALLAIKRILLIFWAAWLSVVVATNAVDALVALNKLPKTVHFASGNWRAINEVMDPISVSRDIQAILFAGAIAWEALAAALFWWAVVTYRGRPLVQERVTLLACGVNLVLWAAFQVMDEVLLSYALETTHRAIFISQLLTLLALQVLPNSSPANHSE